MRLCVIFFKNAGHKAEEGNKDATVIDFKDWEKALKLRVPTNLYRGYREAIVKFQSWPRE